MSLGQEIVKIIVIAIIGIPFFFIGGPILFPLLYLFWKYVKLCLKVDIFVIYFIVRIPIWLFIQVPLWAFGKSARSVEHFFENALDYIQVKRKRAVFVIGGLWILFFLASGTSIPGFSISGIMAVAYDVGFITVGSLVVSLILLSIVGSLGDKKASRSLFEPPEMVGTDPVTGAGQAAEAGRQYAEKGRELADKGRKAKGVYGDIQQKGIKGTTKESSIWPKDLVNKTKGLKRSFSELLGEEAGAEAGAEVAGAEAGLVSNPAGWAILGIILLALFIFVAQLLVVGFYLISIAEFFMPIIGGAMFGAIGLGEDYGSFIGGQIGDQYLAGVNLDVETTLGPVNGIITQVKCISEGPACLRNSTREPNSENVGETYRLELSRFEVGSGEGIDIDGKDGDYSPPISFGLSNTRNGVYGIPAYNVSYRIRVVDYERAGLTGTNDPYCGTGWNPVQGYDLRDVEGKFSGNDLQPGTSASTNYLRLDEINLEDCGLLQPGLGQTKTVLLEAKYDYSSEATLYFEAMSRQVMQQNPDVNPVFKASETADTPVKSVLNVESPVLFDRNELGTGQDAAEPFDIRADLISEDSSVSYKIKGLAVEKSSEVQISESETAVCQLEPKDSNEELLVPSGSAAEILEGQSRSQWFSSNDPPEFFGCRMELIDPAGINPQGQTLSMDIISNYTVKLNQEVETFNVENSRCRAGAFNCPLLVTEQFVEERNNPDNWVTRCEGPDATDGCDVVEGRPDKWSTIGENLMTGRELLDEQLEDGEYAIEPMEWKEISDSRKELLEQSIDGPAAIGISEERYRMMQRGERGFALVSMIVGSDNVGAGGTEREVQYLTLDEPVCAGKTGDPVEIYREETGRQQFLAGEDTRIIVFRPQLERCTGDSGG